MLLAVFFFKQKTAYEMRISDWSSDVCSSDLSKQGEGLLALELNENGKQKVIDTTTKNPNMRLDRKSVVSGKSVSVRVDLGGRRIIKKKKRAQLVTQQRPRSFIKIERDITTKCNRQ